MRMAKAVSAATRLKISRALKGNKNAFSGGSKKKLSTRDKIANINAATKAKKANLSSDQIARRQSVAKRLRAQARREEALGGGVPEVLKTNEQAKAEAGVTRSRASSGSIEKVQERARQVARENNQRREAETAKQRGREASIPRNAKQNLNAPQTPPEQRTAALSPAQRRRQQRSSFEANEAKARLAENQLVDKLISAGRQNEDREIAEFKANRQAGQASEFARQQGAQVVDVPISGRGSRGGGLKADPIAPSKAMRELQGITGKGVPKRADNAAYEKAMGVNNKQDKPRSPQSDTGTDRSGTFTKKVPVKGEKSTRANGRKAIETEQDYQDFVAESTPAIIRKLTKGIPEKDMADLREMLSREMGNEGLSAFDNILKGD